jgi:transcriptional regulator with XRE-family HTH domain
MDIRQVVAAQLREHRRGGKLTPGVLARRADVDRALILRLEDGKANPSLVTIGRIAQALNIEPQELLARPRGKRHMQPYPYPRFRLVDRALIQRCRLPEELVVLATSTPDREAIVHLSAEECRTYTNPMHGGRRRYGLFPLPAGPLLLCC